MATTADDQTTEGVRREKRMTLGEHLSELRRRLMIAAGALIVAAVAAFFLTDFVLELLKWPIDQVVENTGRDPMTTGLMITTVTGGFDLRMKIAFTIAIFLTAPVWIWQLYAYIMPGMTKKEIRYTAWFTATAVPLFFGGCAVALWIAPHVIELMSTFLPGQYSALFDAVKYYDFIFKLLMAVGIAFLLPVLLVAINLTGVLSARDILKGWRVAILIATVFAAITTPGADVTSMLILAGILITLYFLATGICFLFDRRRAKTHAAFMAAEGPA